MPVQKSNAFTEWQFSDLETFAATRFTETQLMLFQTEIAKKAQEKLNIKIVPNDLECLQAVASATGYIEAFEYLIDLFNMPNPNPEKPKQ